MKFLRYPIQSPLKTESVVTIGNFDGVHKGHQELIGHVVSSANKYGLSSVVVSMQPMASEYFNKNHNETILTPFKCKYFLIKNLSVDCFCVLNFNKNLAAFTAEEFIQKILINGLNAKYIVVGDDFKFGKNRLGNLKLMKEYCLPLGVSVKAIQSVTNQQVRISSSQARTDLDGNSFNHLEQILGRKYAISGKVSQGQQLGRELGFPTINIKLNKINTPLNGVFCVKVRFNEGIQFLGAASIGTRPTVGGVENLLEVHILDFNKDVYGRNVEILFYHKLRNEVKFSSLEELKRHIKEDVIKTRQFFKNNT